MSTSSQDCKYTYVEAAPTIMNCHYDRQTIDFGLLQLELHFDLYQPTYHYFI